MAPTVTAARSERAFGSGAGPAGAPPAPPGRVNPCTVAMLAADPPPEDQGTAAGHRPGGVVHGHAQRTDAACRPGRGADRVDPGRRAAPGGQPAQDDQLAVLAGNHHLTADRGGQAPGEQAGLGGGQALRCGWVTPGSGRRPGHRCRAAPVRVGGDPPARDQDSGTEHEGHQERADAAARAPWRPVMRGGPSLLLPVRLAPVRLAPVRLAPVRLVPLGLTPAGIPAGPVSHALIMPDPLSRGLAQGARFARRWNRHLPPAVVAGGLAPPERIEGTARRRSPRWVLQVSRKPLARER